MAMPGGGGERGGGGEGGGGGGGGQRTRENGPRQYCLGQRAPVVGVTAWGRGGEPLPLNTFRLVRHVKKAAGAAV